VLAVAAEIGPIVILPRVLDVGALGGFGGFGLRFRGRIGNDGTHLRSG
jgi:hypothetical protein